MVTARLFDTPGSSSGQDADSLMVAGTDHRQTAFEPHVIFNRLLTDSQHYIGGLSRYQFHRNLID